MDKRRDIQQQYHELLKQYENLKKNHTKLTGVLDSLPNSIYLKDTSFRYTFVNKQSEAQLKKFHHIHENIIGKTDLEIFPQKAAIAYQKNDQEVLQRGAHLRKEESITAPDGKNLVRLSFKQPLYSENGEILGLVGHTVDITDLKPLERDLRIVKEKAEEFNQLKTQFISNMQHDLRSPASGVMQALSHLHDIEKEPKKLEILNFALESSEALMLLLNEIVDSSNADYSNPVLDEPLELETIFKSVCRLNAAGASIKHLNFHYHVDEAIPRIIISDKYRLERILLNLVGNAVKFTQRGEVFFEAKLAKKEGHNLLVEFTVKDTGIGIPENKRRVIFERFVRLEPSNRGLYKGIGLGLTNVREYVRDLEGEFRPIISAQGSGTTFSILIPMKTSLDQAMKLPLIEKSKQKSIDVELPTLEESSTQKAPCGNLLLVEDSLPAQFMTKALLNSIGCDLDIAGTAEEALDMLLQKKYDLIFADIGLPGMDGIEMTRHIRYNERKKGGTRIPIVGQSANASTANRKACIEAGMQDLLAKPLTIQSVKEVLQNYAEPYALSHPVQPFILPQLKNTQIIDQEALMCIWKNTENFKDTFKQTKPSTLKDMENFKEAYYDKNWNRLLFLTHKLRGGFVYLAASRVEEACSYLEEYLSEKKAEEPNEKTVENMYHLIIMELDKALEIVDKL